jgi:hypothetical protein
MQALAAPSFQAGDGAEVQAYLPATEDGFYKYQVRRDRTPALRADALDLYSFEMPSGWKVRVGLLFSIIRPSIRVGSLPTSSSTEAGVHTTW